MASTYYPVHMQSDSCNRLLALQVFNLLVEQQRALKWSHLQVYRPQVMVHRTPILSSDHFSIIDLLL